MKKSLRILLLEDLPDDAVLIERQLRNAGMDFTSLVAEEKTAFETALTSFKPDVILCDHSLPGFNSIEAFQLCKTREEATGVIIPFILVTGNVSEEFAVLSLKAGVDDYILKDRLKRLPNAIHGALKKCHLENERRRRVAEVMAREALMKEAEAMAHLGSWDADLVGQKIIWSDGTYSIYGLTRAEAEPSFELFWKLVHEDDRERLKDELDAAMASKPELEYEFRIINNRGELRYLSCKVQIFRDAGGRPTRLLGFNLDVTGRKKTENALEKKEREYWSLFDQNPDVVFSLDIQGRFTDVNPNFSRLVGKSREALLGTDFRSVLVRSQLEKVYDQFLSAFERKTQQYETVFMNASGDSVTLDVTLMAIELGGRAVGIHCVAKDITRKKDLETLLEHVHRQADSSIGGVDDSSGSLGWSAITRELYGAGSAYERRIAAAFFAGSD